jgi:Zn-dependent membrane protease YugP
MLMYAEIWISHVCPGYQKWSSLPIPAGYTGRQLSQEVLLKPFVGLVVHEK